MAKSYDILIRVVITVAVTAVMVAGGWSTLGWPKFPGDAATLVVWLGLFVLTVIAWMAIWGPSVMVWCGEKVGALFWPSDKHFRIRPEYSIAEAKAAQGRWEEAIAEFRADIEKFPLEPYPHMRIADIQRDRLNDYNGATSEMLLALNKSQNEDTYCLVARRLIDLYRMQPGGSQAAVGLLREIQRRYPETKHARAAKEMLARITADDTGS